MARRGRVGVEVRYDIYEKVDAFPVRVYRENNQDQSPDAKFDALEDAQWWVLLHGELNHVWRWCNKARGWRIAG